MKPTKVRNCTISPIITSSIMGHSGGRILDIPAPITNLWPPYRRLMRVVKERRVVNLTESSTYEKHDGNFRLLYLWTWKYIQRLGCSGLLNAYGLTNSGIEINALGIFQANQVGFQVIPDLYPQFAKGRDLAIMETILAIQILRCHLGQDFWALELNFSCPNAKEKIKANTEDALACVQIIRQEYPNLCLIAKISIVHPHEFAKELVDAGVDIIHAINTIPYDLVYPDGPSSPLQAVGGGGVSGRPAFLQAFYYNKGLRAKIPNTPLIMGCGVVSLDCAQAYFDIGADAVSLCTVCRLNPMEAIRIIEEYA